MSHDLITCEAAIHFARSTGSLARPNIRGRTMTAALKFAIEERRNSRHLLRPVVPADNDRTAKPDYLDHFLEALMEFAAGNFLSPRRAHQSYCQSAAENGWPPIKERKLTKELVARGCRKRVLDLRSGDSSRRDRLRKYGGKLRPVVIEFPGEESAE